VNLFDYLLLAIVGLSMVLSLWRGFVREIISLIGLVAAFITAGRTSGLVGDALGDWIPNATAAEITGFALVFIAVMVVVGLIGALLRKLLDMAELTATDRTLGMLFGLARGLLLIGVFFLIYTTYAKTDGPWMKKSLLAPYAVKLGDLLGQAIPAGYPFSRRGGVTRKLTLDRIPERERQAIRSIIEKSMQ